MNIFKRILRKLNVIKMWPLEARLIFGKIDQLKTFLKLRKEFDPLYMMIRDEPFGKFTTENWDTYNSKLSYNLLNQPSFFFLRDPVIKETMFVSSGGKLLKDELTFLEGNISEPDLKKLLIEDPVGYPALHSAKYLTSHNSIHQLFHLFKYLKTRKKSYSDFKTIVEWGGGYGNLAKIFYRLLGDNMTYVIIDTPILSCLQWLYLASTLGSDKVNIIGPKNITIRQKRINIVPVSFLEKLNLNADLFISTWALSESSVFAQDYVASKNWFNAEHLLLAYQKTSESWPAAGRLGDLAQKRGATISKVENVSKSYYAFL